MKKLVLKKTKAIILASSLLVSTSIIANEDKDINGAYKMGEIVGHQLNKKINIIKNLGHDVDLNNFIHGLNVALIENKIFTDKEINKIIAKLNERMEKPYPNTEMSYKLVDNGSTGIFPTENDTVKLKYRILLPKGGKSEEKEVVLNLSNTMNKWSNALTKMELGSVYEFKIPHFLSGAKDAIFASIIESWVKEEQILEKGNIFNNTVPHQLAFNDKIKKEIAPYSDITVEVKMMELKRES